MKVDILAFGAHPDDVELTCSGTIIKEIRKGRKVAIVDLSRGELGTRGNEKIRMQEAEASSRIMGIHARENLGLRDGFFEQDDSSLLAVVEMIRKYRPHIILCNSVSDRHPDHARGSALVSRASFLSGLPKVLTTHDGSPQEAWRAKAVYHYIQDRYIRPDFIIDVSDVWEERMKAVLAFSSQFYNPDSSEPSTPISSREFLNFLDARSREYGRLMSVEHGEGFTVERPPGINGLLDLI